MPRKLFLAAVVIALLLGVFLFCGDERRKEAPAVPVAPAVARAPAPAPPPTGDRTPAPPERVELPAPAPPPATDPPTPAPPPPALAPPAAAPPPPERADLAARDWLEILVLDPEGRAVADAELSIGGLRKETDPGSWYEMRSGTATATSDVSGLARIDYLRWVDIDGRTSAVDLEVKHTEFVPFRDSSFPIGVGQHPVVLQRGATVVVSGWFGSPQRVVADVTVQVEADAQLPSSGWTREPDGRLSTTQLAPGKHLIRLDHESSELGLLASAVESFELAENEWEVLHVELHPLETLRGRLDDAVPRPVLDGHVMVNLHEAFPGSPRVSISRTFETVVLEDGTFELAGLPRGRGQIIALSSGWVSRRMRVESAEEEQVQAPEGASPEDVEGLLRLAADRALQAQHVSVPTPPPFVVAMEPTGVLEVTVRAPDGSPLDGAFVAASPNVRWVGIGSTIFPWREWSTSTDATGRARIEDLPPEASLWVFAVHHSFRMKLADRDRPPGVTIRSGETTQLEIELESTDD